MSRVVKKNIRYDDRFGFRQRDVVISRPAKPEFLEVFAKAKCHPRLSRTPSSPTLGSHLIRESAEAAAAQTARRTWCYDREQGPNATREPEGDGSPTLVLHIVLRHFTSRQHAPPLFPWFCH